VLQAGKEELENLVSERTAELRSSGGIARSEYQFCNMNAIVMVDDSGTLTYWNEAVTRFSVTPRVEAMGRNFLLDVRANRVIGKGMKQV